MINLIIIINNSSLSDKEIENEILRYICIPTQSLNYKIGELFFKRYVAKLDDTKKHIVKF